MCVRFLGYFTFFGLSPIFVVRSTLSMFDICGSEPTIVKKYQKYPPEEERTRPPPKSAKKKRPRTVSIFTLLMSRLTIGMKGKSLERPPIFSILVSHQQSKQRKSLEIPWGGGGGGYFQRDFNGNRIFLPCRWPPNHCYGVAYRWRARGRSKVFLCARMHTATEYTHKNWRKTNNNQNRKKEKKLYIWGAI